MTENTADAAFPDPGEVPVLDWISKDLIDADPLYQRPLDRARVDGILKDFSWRAFGAIVVVQQANGRYHTPDGQHRLVAAKLHPRVTVVPAIIVKAEDVPAEAGIFVDINKNRKNVSTLELFFAQLAAGDDNALAVLNVCKEAGIRIPKHPGDFKPNDSIAVAAISSLVSGYIAPRAVEFLKIAASGRFAPITAAQIRAIEYLRTDPEFRDQISGDDLATLLTASGNQFDGEAKRFAATHKVSMWKALANVWFKNCRKKRAPAAGPAHTPAREATPAPSKTIPAPVKHLVRRDIAQRAAELAARRASLPRENVTSSVMGDPPAGRSALDVRRIG